MDILLITVVSTLNIVCFFIGAKVGQKVVKGENIEIPSINPMEVIRDREEKKASRKEQEKVDAILHNIEVYNGTPLGQKDIPR